MPEEENNLTIEEIANGAKEIQDCTVRGIIIDIKPGSGIIMRCPQCRRALNHIVGCHLHGHVEGVTDLRIKAAFDDGTGAMMVVMNRHVTEKLMGRTLDWYRALIGEQANSDAPRKEFLDRLIARPIEIRGRVVIDDYGLTMIATQAIIIDLYWDDKKGVVEARVLDAEESGTGR